MFFKTAQTYMNFRKVPTPYPLPFKMQNKLPDNSFTKGYLYQAKNGDSNKKNCRFVKTIA